MDLQSYIQLKKQYVQMHAPQQEPVSEEVEAVEEILSEEETILEFETQDDIDAQLAQYKANQAKKKEAEAARVRRDNQIYRAGGGDAKRKELEGPTNPDGTRRNLGFGGRKGGAGEAAWETRQQGRENLYRAGGGDAQAKQSGMTRDQIIDRGIRATSGGSSSSSSSSSSQQSSSSSSSGRGAKGSTQGSGNNGGASGSSQRSSQPASSSSGSSQRSSQPASAQRSSQPASSQPAAAAKTQPAAPKKDNMANASKADRMDAWAKANPKLAAAKAKRDATRGTTASSNPLMKGMGTKAPANTGIANAKKTVANAVKSSGAAKAVAPAVNTAKKAVASAINPSKATAPEDPKKKAAPTAGAKAAMKAQQPLLNSTDMSEFDIIIEHLVEQGFPVEEALKLMVNMTEEKREQILEAAMHRDAKTGEVVDKAEIGKTYYPAQPKRKSSVALRKEKEAAEKKKTRKEENASLLDAYKAMYVSEEEADKLRDQRQERGGVDGNTRYDKAPKGSTKKHGVPGAKTPAQAEMEKKYGKGASAMDVVRAELEKKYGKGAILGGKKKSDKKD